MLTKEEIAALLPLIQAGIAATGIQLFDNGCGTLVQSAIDKFKAIMATPEPENISTETTETK